MAYFIVAKGQPKQYVYKIAADDAAADNLYCSWEIYDKVPVTESEFNNFKNGTRDITGHDGTNYTYKVLDTTFEAQDALEGCTSSTMAVIDNWLNMSSNDSHPDRAAWESYRDTLKNFDHSSVSYPLNKSWEKYCEDNSITYYNLFQLP
tara:strand:+ start:254 stop:700 length:447 start_codon:yes stop_codon:yes gene_type:complete